MRLERLEISGFKSFSDRSELAFDKGVTAIVGPNGCGKSNVADAITWVMGEQSAKSLRGERMEDVIFSGSDARKPTAAAEVRLKLSGVVKTVSAPAFGTIQPQAHHGHGNGNGNGHGNGHGHGNGNGNGHLPIPVEAQLDAVVATLRSPEDEALSREEAEELIQSVAREVEVTRRLYRSGESEYLIDGKTCRLKDVHELLMDTGLGAKAYAIIEQGKIGLILSSRPTDRRQLIEEAAGVTKYKSRRRAAELKLEAAQSNLTRIDDIVFEVEKQRGTLKRQAGKARRYQKLRDELRRWEKVLFARKYRQLSETIESARTRLAEARERESAAAANVAGIENDLGRIRIELVEAESRSTERRESAHARELAINRQQQQIQFDRNQAEALEARSAIVGAELATLEARREPAQAALAERRDAAAAAVLDRERAAEQLAADAEAYELGHRDIEGLEGDVEAARSQVYAALNSATALRHAIDNARAQHDRVVERLSRLDGESHDVGVELARVDADRATAADLLHRAQEALEAARVGRAARESELASARIEHEWRARSVRSREQELAGLEARLKSLEELEAGRAGFADSARMILAEATGRVGQMGAIADFLEVEPGYERAVEACLGDLLQHVIVERAEQAAAGLALVREHGAGRCGFLVTSLAPAERLDAAVTPQGTLTPLTSVIKVTGPYANAIRQAIGEAWIAPSFDAAALDAQTATCPVVSMTGEVFRGAHLITGGVSDDARGILATKREIKELRDRIQNERDGLRRLADETAALEVTMAQATSAIAALNGELHRLEKAIVGHEAQLQRAGDEGARLNQRGEQLARERRQAEEERMMLEARQEEARASIAQLEEDQRAADEQLAAAQRKLFGGRESVQELSHKAAESRAAHAALVERASALAVEVLRLEEAGAELEQRAQTLAGELDSSRARVRSLREDVAAGELRLDADVAALEDLRAELEAADAAVFALRSQTDRFDATIREARGAYESIRTVVSDLDIARVTAEADLTHLANSCQEAVQATLDEVLAEVQQLEAEGNLTPDAAAIDADEPEETDEDGVAVVSAVPVAAAEAEATDLSQPHAAVLAAEQHTMSAEEAIVKLRQKIERLGPVNMMAIEQHEELETRHFFLTTQRKDLVESIAQTAEAIKRIDETTRERFAEAFAAINRNFQEIFATLFGGGRAALTLLDESDPLESGIEIIAQPPGKRLQNVQLLSGGEKALTAISLMFGLFKYKPSPFCLLDEIDAPLDDANVGRFVEMLRGMLDHTQFILITHHRKTMEIADRLYGVTMEEPGVSKLISVQLH